MASDKLYDLAFAYKKTRLWTRIEEDQIFAVELPDGRMAYVSIMGRNGEYNGINAYIGDSFQMYRKLSTFNPWDFMGDEFVEFEFRMGQDCLQLTWENKDGLMETELQEATAYGKKYHHRYSGKESYPRFLRFAPSMQPWPITDEAELGILAETLEAALAVAALELEKEIPHFRKQKTVPRLVRNGQGFVKGKRVAVPAESQEVFPIAGADRLDQVSWQKLKKCRKKETIECGLLMLPAPVAREGMEGAYFPYILMSVKESNGEMLEFEPFTRQEWQSAPQKPVNQLIAQLVKAKLRPSQILCQDERTCALLQGLGEVLKVEVRQEDDLPELEECKDSMLEYLEMMDDKGGIEDYDGEFLDDVTEEEAKQKLLEFLLEMPDDQARQAPAEVQMLAQMLVMEPDIPDISKKRIRKKFQIQ